MIETLEAIVVDPSRIDVDGDVRCGLYKLFLQLWHSNALKVTPVTKANSTDEAGTARHLDAMSVMPRVALLLTALEGCDIGEVARTLDCSIDETRTLLKAANTEIARQISTDVLIIEDQPLVALDLPHIDEDLGHTVSDIARTHQRALKAVQHQRPGLILADIKLEDGSSGLDAVNVILDLVPVPVISSPLIRNVFSSTRRLSPLT